MKLTIYKNQRYMDNVKKPLRGYVKVFVYKSIDDPKIIYVSKSLHFLNKFFINRYNGDSSNFIYDGEMMVRLRIYYTQVYHGVYKRIYKNDIKPQKTPVKLKKQWVYANLKGNNLTKLKKVIVGWRHLEKIKTDDGIIKVFKFPQIVYEDNDLKGRTNWSNIKWLRQAVIDYIEHTKYDPKNIDETFVNRIKIL